MDCGNGFAIWNVKKPCYFIQRFNNNKWVEATLQIRKYKFIKI